MKNIFLLTIFTCLSLGFFSCKKQTINYDSVLIRLKNNSTYNMDSILINTSKSSQNYGNLAAGDTTGYRSFDVAYATAFVNARIDGNHFVFQPDSNFTNQTYLENGKYMYLIEVKNYDTQELNLIFQEE